MEGRGGVNVSGDALLALLGGRRLSPAQRRIAQYLLDHMPASAFLSSVALAQRAGVSQPSVTRFAAALGFSGYPALREALRVIALGPAGPADADSLVPGAGLGPQSSPVPGASPGPQSRTPAAAPGNPMHAAAAAEIAHLQALHQAFSGARRCHADTAEARTFHVATQA